MMATENMKKFIELNQIKLVVSGERQTPEGGPILSKSDLDRADRILYRFDDDQEFVLLSSDTRSAPDFTPQWAH